MSKFTKKCRELSWSRRHWLIQIHILCSSRSIRVSLHFVVEIDRATDQFRVNDAWLLYTKSLISILFLLYSLVENVIVHDTLCSGTL